MFYDPDFDPGSEGEQKNAAALVVCALAAIFWFIFGCLGFW